MIFNGSIIFFSISGQFSMLSSGNFTFVFVFSSIFHVIQLEFCIFFIFLSIFHVIQWEICIFLLFFVNFPYYLMGSLHFVNSPCYSMGIQDLRSFRGGRTDRRTYIIFAPVSYRTLALWGCCPALTPLPQLITPSRASGTADHVRSLDD